MATNRLSKRELDTIMGPHRIRKELEAITWAMQHARGIGPEMAERLGDLEQDTLASMRHASLMIAEYKDSIASIGTSIWLTEDERPELEKELQQWRNLNNELTATFVAVRSAIEDAKEMACL